jgi:succinate dehydrogenase flavin-adding protein (antitoxin of CptAB toxin-antitoxin module)
MENETPHQFYQFKNNSFRTLACEMNGLIRFAHVVRKSASVSRKCFSSTVNSSEQLLNKMETNNKKLKESYDRIKGVSDEKEYDDVRRKRLIYRAKQRGWLEADILLGSWAKENVAGLNNDEMDQFETILQEETIDLYNYVSAKDPLPEHLSKLPLMHKLQEYAKLTKIDDPQSYAALKLRNNLI